VGRQGYYRDSDLSTYWLRARFYDPLSGRFTSRDLLGFEAGDVNLYRYVGNDPTNAADPSGLQNCNKKCGVKTFVVTYNKPPKSGLEVRGYFLAISFRITFKKDKDHAPEKCEFKQYVRYYEFTWNGDDQLKKGQKEWRADKYSRDDDLKSRPRTDTEFEANDFPGISADAVKLLSKGDKLKWVTEWKQVVIDTTTKKEVAQRGPHKVTMETDPGWPKVKWIGVPKTLDK
jgi:RHS repeat-associated protein